MLKSRLSLRWLSLLVAISWGLTASESLRADALVSWDFSGLDYTAIADNSPVPNPVLTPAEANAVAGLTVSDLTSSGLLTSVGNLIAGEGNFKNWDAGGDGTNDNYLEFTIESPVMGGLTLDSISISSWRNGGGAPNGMAFDISVDGGQTYAPYGGILNDDNAGDMMFETYEFSETIDGLTTLGIRFTPRNAGAGSTGNIHIESLVVNGSLVPEPSGATLLLIGFAAFLRRRSRS